MLQDEIERLARAAEDALKNAIAPYSGFKVGAAILSSDGKVYTGCNVENYSLMLAMCAERVALLKALSEGEREFTAMAVSCSDGEACFPCGACRQMLFEFAPNLKIIVSSKDAIRVFGIKELLPFPFVKPE